MNRKITNFQENVKLGIPSCSEVISESFNEQERNFLLSSEENWKLTLFESGFALMVMLSLLDEAFKSFSRFARFIPKVVGRSHLYFLKFSPIKSN